MKQCRMHGLPIPDEIKNAPTLRQGLELYYTAFIELNTCRNAGFSLMPISWASIMSYAQAYGFSTDQTEDLLYLIFQMDKLYLRRNQPKETKKGMARKRRKKRY